MPTNPSDSMSSRPQPSGNDTFDQSNPSTDLGTGKRACLRSLSLLALSRWAISDSSMPPQAATCPGVADARKASMVWFDMNSALAAALKAADGAPRPALAVTPRSRRPA